MTPGRPMSIFMRRRSPRAHAGEADGEVPVGALVVLGGEVIGEGWNQPIGSARPDRACGDHRACAPARIRAQELPSRAAHVVRDVGALRHVHRRGTQCAALAPGVRRLGPEGRRLRQRLRFAARDRGSTHRIDVFGGVCSEESRALLRRFFEASAAAS